MPEIKQDEQEPDMAPIVENIKSIINEIGDPEEF